MKLFKHRSNSPVDDELTSTTTSPVQEKTTRHPNTRTKLKSDQQIKPNHVASHEEKREILPKIPLFYRKALKRHDATHEENTEILPEIPLFYQKELKRHDTTHEEKTEILPEIEKAPKGHDATREEKTEILPEIAVQGKTLVNQKAPKRVAFAPGTKKPSGWHDKVVKLFDEFMFEFNDFFCGQPQKGKNKVYVTHASDLQSCFVALNHEAMYHLTKPKTIKRCAVGLTKEFKSLSKELLK